MIVDTSAVVAVISGELLADQLFDRIASSSTCRLSAANLLDSYMVIDRSSVVDADLQVHRFLVRARASIEPVTHAQVVIARDAFRRFGKGSGHPARLNFGDCFAYALARFYNEPLLFVGGDFAVTDIESALPASNP